MLELCLAVLLAAGAEATGPGGYAPPPKRPAAEAPPPAPPPAGEPPAPAREPAGAAEPAPAPRPLAAAPGPAAMPGPRPVRFVLAMGLDRGSEELARVEFTDGSTETLRANSGFYLSVGLATFRKALGAAVIDTSATLGVKGWEVGADNGDISYLAFPFEVMERIAFDQVRFGAGVSILLSPSYESSGVLADAGDADLKSSLGLLFQAEWIGQRTGASGAFLGVRGVFQKLEGENGAIVDANAFGVVLGLEL
jgi:hypothetical protein